jgi:predicted DNA-binding protein
MRNSEVATSIKLPKGADALIEKLAKEQNISKTKFMREAILERIESLLDIQAIEEVLARNEQPLSLEEAKRKLDLAD